MTSEQFYTIYREKFLIAYSDLVALTATKPTQILIEESNILSHIVQFNNSLLAGNIRQENLDKAYNHLIRATLDLHKLIWASLREELNSFIIGDRRKRLCFNISEELVVSKYKSFFEQARDARKNEM